VLERTTGDVTDSEHPPVDAGYRLSMQEVRAGKNYFKSILMMVSEDVRAIEVTEEVPPFRRRAWMRTLICRKYNIL